MDVERYRRLKALAEQALEHPTERRATFVAEAAGSDPSLRDEVLRWLDASRAAESDDFLHGAAGELPAAEVAAGESRYRLQRELGRGGMGVVYLAERVDGEFQQRVAIKMLALDAMRDAQAVRRFRAERQLLAHLEHPNIARLIDGGTLDDGRPFLVMEYIDGEPIDRWCETRGLDTRARLRLLLPICAAVAYAHRNLVVHRDLKPSNILVDAQGQPKLLDFGIAKLLQNDEGESPATATADRLLTFGYASPEQIQGGPVGTASDVYSLGVVLYRLLTGRLPYRAAEDSLPALARAICDEEAATPSQRWRDAAHATPRLDRELDHLLLKALRKEPAQRYSSIEQFAEDLQRYLDGRPLLARRGSRAYRARKFLLRHRWAVGSAALILLLVAGFAIEREQQLAATAQERDRAQRLVSFLTGVFEGADPEKSGGRKLSVADVLEAAQRRAQTDAQQRPLDRAAMLHALGDVYRSLGDFERAATLLNEAYRLRKAAPEAELEAAASAIALAGLRRQQQDYPGADALYRDALALYTGHYRDDAVPMLDLRMRMALLRNDQGESAQAVQDLQDLVQQSLDALGLDAVPETVPIDRPKESLIQLASLLSHAGSLAHERKDWARAQPLLEQALSLRRQLLADSDPALSQTLNALANLARERGDLHTAHRWRQDVLAQRQAAYGPEHWQVGVALVNLGDGLAALARWDEALQAAQRATDILQGSLGENHAYTLIALGNQATALSGRGDYAESLALTQEVLQRRRASLAPGHPDIALALYQTASTLAKLGRNAESFDYYTQSFILYAALYGGEHPYLDENRVSEAEVLARLDRIDEAEQRLRTVVAHDGHADASPLVVAIAQFRLAQLIADRQREKAHQLAQAAQNVAEREGRSDGLDPAEIRAWLAAHAAPPTP